MHRLTSTRWQRVALMGALASALACGNSSGKSKNNLDAGGSNAGNGGDGSTAATNGGGTNGNAGSNSGDGGSAGANGDSAGEGGAPACSTPCADEIDCTADMCVADGVCTHELDGDLCEDGKSCHPMKGCTAGAACSTPEDCADTDGCTANERCDATLKTCQFDPLDGDGDGQAPVSCGGADCDDDNRRISVGETERCNGEDDDCDGMVDDGATCDEGEVCEAGACACKTGFTRCDGGGPGGGGGTCVDLKSDQAHCGMCEINCGSAGVCNDSKCECPAPGELCGELCVNTQYSFQNCGMCGEACDPGQACVKGACGACGENSEACCPGFGGGGDGCEGAFTCSGTPSTEGAVCECAGENTVCGDTCANLSTSRQHCGKCDNACETGEACLDTGTGPTCTECGGLDEPCCVFNGNEFCGTPGGGGNGGGNDLSCEQGKCVNN